MKHELVEWLCTNGHWHGYGFESW